MYIEQYIDYINVERNLAEHTIKAQINDLESCQSYVRDMYDVPLSKSKSIHLRSYIVHLTKSNFSNRSINRRLSTLRMFFKYLLFQDIINIDPTLHLRAPKIAKRLPKSLKQSEVANLLDLIPEVGEGGFEDLRDCIIIILFLTVGLRRTELIDLTLTSFDNYNNTLKIYGKGSKERIVPITSSVSQKLQVYLYERLSLDVKYDNLFLTKKLKPLYPKAVYRIVKSKISLVSPISKQSPHVLRHTVANLLLDNGADIVAIKDLLGHSSLAATQIYTHSSISKLKQSYKTAHPRENSINN